VSFVFVQVVEQVDERPSKSVVLLVERCRLLELVEPQQLEVNVVYKGKDYDERNWIEGSS
jgi:hypothetical protein